MTYDNILIWIDSKVDAEDWESKDTLKNAIRTADSEGRIADWIENEGIKGGGTTFFSDEFEPRFEAIQGEKLAEEIEQLGIPSSQVESIQDIYGFEEEDIRDMGVRGLQQAIEGVLFGRIEEAQTIDDLEVIQDDLESVPTQSGVRRLKSDINSRRKELLAQEEES